MRKKRKLTEADRRFLEQVDRNTERTRQLAEKALAELERKAGGPVRPAGVTNDEWLRQLAGRRLQQD